VTYFRKLSDFKKLEKQSREQFSGKTIAVVGGGFLGSELAVALGKQADRHDFKVNQIIKEKGNLGYILPDYLSKWTTEKVKKCNVNVVPNERITGASKLKNGKVQLKLISGKKMIVDHVVAAVGLEIDEKFAENSDLEWDNKLNGFMVNSELQARSNVWVAGDATSFYDIRLGRRKVEHHDHAIVSGRLAGANMAAIDKPQTPYWHQSMFWSDLGPEVGFEAIGLVDSKKLRTVGFFAKATNLDTPEQREKAKEYASSAVEERGQVPIVESKDYGKGVIFYLNNKSTVVGMISWNLFGKMKVARKIIADKIQANDEETLKDLARLFKIDP